MFTTVESITTTYVTTIFPAVSAIHNALRRQPASLNTHRDELNGAAVKEARMHRDGDAKTLQVLTANNGWVSVLPGDKVVQYKIVTETPNEQEIFYNELFAEQEEPERAPNVVTYQLAQVFKMDHYELHKILVRFNVCVVIQEDGWASLAPLEYLRLGLALSKQA